MKKHEIEKVLHQRSPYLLIDEVISHSNQALVAKRIHKGEEFYLQGHFPEVPIVPGAMMQEMTTQAAGILITLYHSPVKNYDSQMTKGWALGVLRAIHKAKYLAFVRPTDELKISVSLIDHVENLFRFKGQILVGEMKVMTNEFSLINISDYSLFHQENK